MNCNACGRPVHDILFDGGFCSDCFVKRRAISKRKERREALAVRPDEPFTDSDELVITGQY